MTQTVVAAALIFQWVGKSGASKRHLLNAEGNFGTCLKDSCLIEAVTVGPDDPRVIDVIVHEADAIEVFALLHAAKWRMLRSPICCLR